MVRVLSAIRGICGRIRVHVAVVMLMFRVSIGNGMPKMTITSSMRVLICLDVVLVWI